MNEGRLPTAAKSRGHFVEHLLLARHFGEELCSAVGEEPSCSGSREALTQQAQGRDGPCLFGMTSPSPHSGCRHRVCSRPGVWGLLGMQGEARREGTLVKQLLCSRPTLEAVSQWP